MWAHLGSNQGPRSYQERALPLSHAPKLSEKLSSRISSLCILSKYLVERQLCEKLENYRITEKINTIASTKNIP